MTGGWPGSTTQCPPDCGVCCEHITLPRRSIEQIFGPRFEENCATEVWTRVSLGSDPERPVPNPRGLNTVHDATFIREYFDVEPEGTFSCRAFDAHARRCTMYDQRPLMCENYPFYGRDPAQLGDRDPINDLVCAFQGDVPPRRVLPLTVLTKERP